MSYINTYIWNLENGTDEPICRAGVEMQTQGTDMWTRWGEALDELGGGLTYIYLFSHSVKSNCSPPGSSVHRISQAIILQWAAIYFPRESSQPRDGTRVSFISCVSGQVLYR